MKAFIKRILKLPIGILNSLILKVYLFFQKRGMEEIEDLSLQGKRVLILAPHQDDEVLGCSFVLEEVQKKNCTLKCVYMTDGSKSVSHIGNPLELSQKRKEESLNLMEYIGAETPIFLDFPDGELEKNLEKAPKLQSVMGEYQPDVVFLPYFLDGHKDHTATSLFFLRGMDAVSKHLEIYCYEVNSPMGVNFASHKGSMDGLESKKRQLSFYDSQIMSFESILQMNRLHGGCFKEKREVELYKKVDFLEYQRVNQKYNDKNQISQEFRQMYSIYFMIPAYLKGMKWKKKIGEELQNKKR